MDKKYVTADADMADEIYRVLHTTIKTIYPRYYPGEPCHCGNRLL